MFYIGLLTVICTSKDLDNISLNILYNSKELALNFPYVNVNPFKLFQMNYILHKLLTTSAYLCDRSRGEYVKLQLFNKLKVIHIIAHNIK